MPECLNCESSVSKAYVRVFAPETGADSVRVCPECEDMIRDGSGVREARSPRHANGAHPSTYDPLAGESDD